jgi:hypothetical protein
MTTVEAFLTDLKFELEGIIILCLSAMPSWMSSNSELGRRVVVEVPQ